MRESEATSRKVRTSSRKSRECFAAESMYRVPRVRFSEVDWREGGERRKEKEERKRIRAHLSLRYFCMAMAMPCLSLKKV